MDTKFDREEIKRLKGILKYHPQGDNAISVISELMDVQELANRIKYPINTFGELLKQIGEQEELKVGENKVIFKDIKDKIPAYYFPITCEEDFMDKTAELMGQNQDDSDFKVHPVGEEISVENAPRLPRELIEFKYSGEIPASGSKGFKIEDIVSNYKRKGEP